MSEIRVTTPPTPEAEPVTLALLKQHVRVDGDTEDELLQLYLSAAREKVEAFTGRYFAAQALAITYCLGEPYVLPSGATATAVTGFYTDLDALTNAPAYLEEYRKGISINRELSWPEALAQTYTVAATTAGDTQYANLAKRAILELAGEWYKNRETTSVGSFALTELPVSWRVTLAEACINPIGF